MSEHLDQFLDPESPSLKICGVTTADDAEQLADIGVHALGVNFWSKSKRYCSPEDAAEFLGNLESAILRVGVFVNAPFALPLQLLQDKIIDVAQFHGDEDVDYCLQFAEADYPFIKAVSLKSPKDITSVLEYDASSVLVDGFAQGEYGGTGRLADWELARVLVEENPDLPVILAGGIGIENAAQALDIVNPSCLDVASGAELEPGIKDFKKVQALYDLLS